MKEESNCKDTPETEYGGDDTAATAVRLLLFVSQLALTGSAIAVLRPTRRELRAALAAGLTAALFDFFLESLAYENDLWYCHGGFQKIKIGDREFDMLKVPAEMLAGFVFSGMYYSLMGDAPRLLRRRHPALALLLPEKHDRRWKHLFAVATSMSGAAGDFSSKSVGMWENDPGWTYWHCAFAAWLPLISLTMFVYDSGVNR